MLGRLRRRLPAWPAPDLALAPGEVAARCQFCSGAYALEAGGEYREAPTCPRCRASGRAQAIAHLLASRVWGLDVPFCDLPVRKDLRIVGLSDDATYARRLRRISDYTNTYYHREPRLDITRPAAHHKGRYDALIAADVFEHVTAPPAAAFEGAMQVLKPGGHLILTVPYTLGEHEEHFPGIAGYETVRAADGNWHARIRYADGREAIETEPVFHGGPGKTLEVRLFSEASLRQYLEAAGFVDIDFLTENRPEASLVWSRFSRPIVARRPLDRA